MVGKTAPIRAHDAKRMDTIATYCGCLPCLLVSWLDVHTSIEHVTEAGRRIDQEEQHQWTIGLCGWHHFGHYESRWNRQEMSGMFGPTLAWGRKPFEEHFGDEVHVLVPTQDFMLELFDQSPWPEYNVPRHVAREVRNHWIELRHAHVTGP